MADDAASDWAATRPAKERIGFLESVRRNAVALISLAVALSGFGYNTWRNETTEAHRNVREASFRVLEELGELQQIVDRRFYADEKSDRTRISGWGKVALIRDMCRLVSPSTEANGRLLFSTWQERIESLDAGDAEAEQAMTTAIVALRDQVLSDLDSLQ